ncbi:MAG: Crp/Fnr family transcriptional regulator [Bacteroidota bacterium]
MKELKIKKGQIIQREGDENHKVYHVKSGLLRSYAIDKNGKESIFLFAPEGWTIADYNAPEVPSELFIDALEDSTVVALPKDLKREQQNVGPIIKRLSVLQSRIIMLQSTSAIERYEHFLKTYPEIAQRVPQRMIASYLGVNPETLSAAKSARRKKLG